MHRQIVCNFDGNLESVSRLWGTDPLWNEDARTFVFADLCGDAIKAADYMRLSNENRRDLLYLLRERVYQHSVYINTQEVLSTIEQINQGTSIYEVDWHMNDGFARTGTEAS